MSCIFIINNAEALKLLQDHIVYISFYTANAQLTANLIRLPEIFLNYTFIFTLERQMPQDLQKHSVLST